MTPDAHLATIYSAEEQKFVQENFPERVWLGGNDINQEGTWVWSDGTCWDYTNWRTGQPDNRELIQNCLLGNMGSENKWVDSVCTEENLFVCMRCVRYYSSSNFDMFRLYGPSAWICFGWES